MLRQEKWYDETYFGEEGAGWAGLVMYQFAAAVLVRKHAKIPCYGIIAPIFKEIFPKCWHGGMVSGLK